MKDAEGGKSKGAVTVVNRKGRRSRFLRGFVTHDLVQRGVDFDRAYSIASSVRDAVGHRQEVSTAELSELVEAALKRHFGDELPRRIRRAPRAESPLSVIYQGERVPFSRGLLARSIYSSGLDLDEAYLLVAKLLEALREEGVEEIRSEEVVRRVSRLLVETEGESAAQQYLLVRRITRLPRPLVIYIGGASGTGKSTLALELAPLLRIYRLGSTDMIRQVMRMVFSEKVLPALHSSSFEPVSGFGAGLGEEPLRPGDQEFGERLITSYEEQSARVAVGIRAIVERAIAENTNLIVEGVHLCPPLVPFPDLEGAVFQVPIVLGMRDSEAHRARFLSRSGGAGRRADRYLEKFEAIRQIHDFVLGRAEQHDVQLVDTSEGEAPVQETVRLVTEMLGSRLPVLQLEGDRDLPKPVPTLMLIIDGLTDRPVRALGGRTPLRAAKTPTLDRLAKEGQVGLADPVAPGVVPDTAAGTLALFGQSPVALKRGPVEAMGAGLRLGAGDVALRGNFATLNELGQVVDRRAGRIREGAEALAAALDRISLPGGLGDEVEVRVKGATEHRLAIVLRGERLSSSIDGSDPGDGAALGPPLTPSPIDASDEAAIYTARVLAVFEQEARRVLDKHPVNAERAKLGLPLANGVITRGAGRIHRLLPLEEAGFPLRITCIAGDRTILGLAGWLGAKTLQTLEMTASLDTNLGAKFESCREALADADLVVVHVKGADIAAHDRRPELKVDFIERLDVELGRFLASWEGPLRVAVGSDHATLCESGQHAADPLPVLIWGEGIEKDPVEVYDEQSARAGSLQRFPLQMFLAKLYQLR